MTDTFPTRKSLRVSERRLSATAKTTSVADFQKPRAAAPRPPKKKERQHRFVALFTILIVPGFFAATSIPAFAVGTPDTNPESWSSASAPVAVQAVSVDELVQTDALVARDVFTAPTHDELVAQKATAARLAARAAARAGAFSVVGARAAGDDYPWAYSTGLSPLGYITRQCVDFVAWRLNRDAGTTSAPYKLVWAYMTPNGGSASAWASAWANHGWATSHTPVIGAVAWFTGNHVAYVKGITADGQVELEEYNWNGSRSYHTRTIPSSSVALFLYPPP